MFYEVRLVLLSSCLLHDITVRNVAPKRGKAYIIQTKERAPNTRFQLESMK